MTTENYSLGYKQSAIETKMKMDQLNLINEQQKYLREMLYEAQKDLQAVDEDGFPLINCTQANLWFATNVIFIFGKGAVYDADDDVIFGNIMNAFYNDIHGRAFLINKFFIEDYITSTVLQGLEKKLYIAHGNYHICLIPVVINGADVEHAPEKMYNKIGVVDKFLQWDTINAYLYGVLAKYGLYSDPKNNIPEELHPMLPEGFNFDEIQCDRDMEKKIEANLQKASALKIERGYINYGGRDQVKTDRSVQFNDTRNKGKNNLYNRINAGDDNTQIDSTVPSKKKGATTKFEVDYIANLPRTKNPDHFDYQVNDDPNSYDPRTRSNFVTQGTAMQTSSGTIGAFTFHKQHPKITTKRDLLVPQGNH